MNMDSVYDRALLEIGNKGKYQKQYDIVYNVGLIMFWSMAYMNILLCLTIIPHTCRVPEQTNNVSELEWKIKNIPTYVDIAGQVQFDSCLKYSNRDDNNHTEECIDFNYDKTWYEWTVSSENDWVCSKELYVANTLAFSKIGESIGSIIFGWLGDIWGRRPTLLVSILMLIVGRLTSLLGRKSYVIFVFGCVFATMPSWSVSQSISVISMEISSATRRTVISTLRLAFYSIGMTIMALLYWWLRDWKVLMVVTTAPLIPYLIYSYCYIIESPRWLHTMGRNNECVKHLIKIAKRNKRQLEEDTKNELLTAAPITRGRRVSPFVLFAGRRLATNTIMQMVLWATASLSYTVLVLKSGEKTDGNPFFEFAWQCLAEVPANFVAAWFADNIGRRHTSCLSNGVMTLVWVMILFRETGRISWVQHWLVGSSIVILGRLSVFILYYTINLFGMELYPTYLRQSGMSLGNVVSGAAAAMAPYILYLGRQYDTRASFIILIISSSIGIIASLILPETLNTELPETLADAQIVGKKIKKQVLNHEHQELNHVKT